MRDGPSCFLPAVALGFPAGTRSFLHQISPPVSCKECSSQSFFHPRTQCWSDLSPFTPRSWPQSIHSRVSFTPPNQGLSSLLAIDLFLVLERVHLLGNMSNENWDGPCSVLAQPLGVFLTLDCGDSGGGGGVGSEPTVTPFPSVHALV